MKRIHYTLTPITLALVTLSAYAVRVFRLDVQSLWYDEGVTAEVARRGLADLTRWTANDIQPPLYYYLVAGWGHLAGWTEWSLRFPSAFFGTLTVPLIAAVTYSLTRRRSASLLAALLAAFHPLLVYYSQEARMYAMLTALGVVLAYLVVDAESDALNLKTRWTIYVIVATAAIYTHYFAFFLLLAVSLAFFVDQLIILPRRERRAGVEPPGRDGVRSVDRKILGGFLIANAIVLLLYLPWISTLLTRLSIDSSYWDGAFKLDEALRHIGVSFVGGETILEEQAVRLLAPYAAATGLLVLPLLRPKSAQIRTLIYSILWLTVPIAGVLLLASLVPKFNARYVIMALPGLILLWAAGLTEMSSFSNWRLWQGFRTPLSSARSLFSVALTFLLLIGFAYADYNWFTDPAFTKAEWRQLVEYVRTTLREQGDEAGERTKVVLVSGHAWPVWNYYAPDLPPLRLPDLEILDVNAILDFKNSAIPLRNALEGKTDVWLVEWQGEIVDPMGIVPVQLNLAGREQRSKPQFWQLQYHHYIDVDANAVLVEPTEISDKSVNFGNQVYLLDYTVAENGDLLLFWQVHPDHEGPIPDLHITGNTTTADGLPMYRLRDRRPASYEYPAFRWAPEQITLGRVLAEDWAGPGALPGDYRLKLGVYDAQGDLTGLDVIGDEGRPLGKSITLDLNLRQPTEGPDIVNKVTFAQIIPDLFTEILLSAEKAEPGELIPAEMHWYAEEKPPGDYELLLRWRLRSSGEIVDEERFSLSTLPTSHWPDDELLRTVHTFRAPLGLQPGEYWLDIGLSAPDSSFVRLPFQILRSTRMFRAPPVTTPIDETFGDNLHLLGIMEPVQNTMTPSEQVALTFVWRTMDRLPIDYTATLQWLDEEGRPAAQADTPLPGGSSRWLPGQVEFQTFLTTAPAEPGNYQLVTAVYNANETDLPRLRTSDGRDLLVLDEVTIAGE
ncbi:MAG: glycosyltransferase family 39 protein [Caldilineaceae bacterium]